MSRALSGSLEDLAPQTLLRLLAAVQRSGSLEIQTDGDRLRLDIARGRVARPDDDALEHAGKVLSAGSGRYRFQPGPLASPPDDTVPLDSFLLAAMATVDPLRVAGASRRTAIPMGPDGAATPRIHVLPAAPPENPLDELLAELEDTAPGEVLLSEVGVVAADPRPWRGSLEHAWRRRGWRVRLHAGPVEVPVDELDALVVHHRLSTTRVGHEDDWIRLLGRAATATPRVPVVWVGPLGDPVWIHRLVASGVDFLLPPPQGEGGDAQKRFVDAITTVVDRQLRVRHDVRRSELDPGVSELVDALLRGAEPEEAMGALLQLAASQLTRGAVLTAEGTSFRCRAGFGYPLEKGSTALPRGVGLLERVLRSGQAVVGLEPDAAGAVQLARVLGLARLPEETVLVSLGRGSSAGGLLVADCHGEPLPELEHLEMLAGRFGGLVVSG